LLLGIARRRCYKAFSPLSYSTLARQLFGLHGNVKRVEDKVERQGEDIQQLVLKDEEQESKIIEHEERIKKIEKSASESSGAVGTGYSAYEDAMAEMERRMRKEGNLIIRGLKPMDGKEDEALVIELFKAVGVNLNTQDFRYIRRLEEGDAAQEEGPLIQVSGVGVAAQKERPLLLQIAMVDMKKKEEMIRKAKDLRKKDAYRGVFVNPDLTRTQRDAIRSKVEEAKRFNGNPAVAGKNWMIIVNRYTKPELKVVEKRE